MVEHHARVAEIVTTTMQVTMGPVSSFVEITPLSSSTATDAVVVAISTLPWDAPHYQFDPNHLGNCVVLLQKVVSTFQEAPQTNAQAGQVQELEAQLREMHAQMEKAQTRTHVLEQRA